MAPNAPTPKKAPSKSKESDFVGRRIDVDDNKEQVIKVLLDTEHPTFQKYHDMFKNTVAKDPLPAGKSPTPRKSSRLAEKTASSTQSRSTRGAKTRASPAPDPPKGQWVGNVDGKQVFKGPRGGLAFANGKYLTETQRKKIEYL